MQCERDKEERGKSLLGKCVGVLRERRWKSVSGGVCKCAKNPEKM